VIDEMRRCKDRTMIDLTVNSIVGPWPIDIRSQRYSDWYRSIEKNECLPSFLSFLNRWQCRVND
jgi:hypothetical protein